MKTLSAALYYRAAADLGEGPVWDAGTLYWVDITGKAIFAKREDAAQAKHYPVGVEVGSLVLWQDDRVVLATGSGFQSFDLSTGKREPWPNPEEGLADNRFNDGKCDPRGRFVAGTMNRHGVAAQGALYSLNHDRRARRIFGPVSCSNGLAWTEAGTTLYYIDTPSRVVRAFAYELDTGELSAERVVIAIPKGHGSPDGMTIDRAGNLWIGLWDGWAVECWSPSSGQGLARIEVPAARVTSCTFGGAGFDTLFITTARTGLDERALAGQELAGSVFTAHPGASGWAPVHFAG